MVNVLAVNVQVVQDLLEVGRDIDELVKGHCESFGTRRAGLVQVNPVGDAFETEQMMNTIRTLSRTFENVLTEPAKQVRERIRKVRKAVGRDAHAFRLF